MTTVAGIVAPLTTEPGMVDPTTELAGIVLISDVYPGTQVYVGIWMTAVLVTVG